MINKQEMDKCTACLSCVIQCPFAMASSKFKGPKMVGPAQARFRLMDEEIDESVNYCANCKNCDITCPSGVPVSSLNMIAKNTYARKNGQGLRDLILASGELFGKLATPFAPIANFAMANPITKGVLGMIGIAPRALPSYEFSTFESRFKKLKQKSSNQKVVFFPGCYIKYNAPQVGIDVVKVLNHLGYEVIVTETVCCGTPILTNGFFDKAQNNAVKNTNSIKPYMDKGYPLITACTSCGLMLKQEMLEMYDIGGAQELSNNHYDIHEFLIDVVNIKATDLKKNKSLKYLYHTPCHLRAQGIGTPGYDILKELLKDNIKKANSGCCGIAGSYGYKKEKYEISMEVGKDLFNEIHRHQPDMVVTECATCQLQIVHGTKAKTVHPITLIREALGIE